LGSGIKEVDIIGPLALKELNKQWDKKIKYHPATRDDMAYGSGEWYAGQGLQTRYT